MRGVVFLLVTGCGFTAPAGQQQPVQDAPKDSDAPTGSDAPMADVPMIDAMIDAPTGPQCPAGYSAIASLTGSTSKYKFVNAPQLSFEDAERDCEDDGGPQMRPTHLIVLDDATEKTAMMAGLTGGTLINDQWIGVSDLPNEGNGYEWVTNQPTTLTVTPSGNADNKDCVRVKDTGVEEARDCAETNKYVCECDMFAANPQHFPNPPDGNN